MPTRLRDTALIEILSSEDSNTADGNLFHHYRYLEKSLLCHIFFFPVFLLSRIRIH